MTTCSPRKATQNSASVRCSSPAASRSRPPGPSRAATPATTAALNAASTARPLARETNHSACEPPSTALIARLPAAASPPRRGASRRTRGCPARHRCPGRPPAPGQPFRSRTRPSWPVSRAGRPGRGQPVLRRGARHDRRRAGRVGVGAGRRGHGRRAPRPVRGPPGPRVHDVVQHRAAAAPPPDGDRRGRDRARGQPDELAPRLAARRPPVRLLGHGDRPAVPRRRPGHGDVAAQADQDAARVDPVADMAARTARSAPSPLAVAPRSSRMPGGSRSSGPSSRTSCQPGAGTGRPRWQLAARADGREVAVVAERDERVPDRRVGQPAGPPGGGQRHPDRLRQAVAEQERPAPGGVQPAQFRIRAEPARLPVQRGQHVIGRGARRAEVFRRPHHDAGAGAQRRRARPRRRRRPRSSPAATSTASVSPRVPAAISCPPRPGRAWPG